MEFEKWRSNLLGARAAEVLELVEKPAQLILRQGFDAGAVEAEAREP
ncbi:MAG: hypothetical protein WAT66_04710 [Actinomycetota bacterium]